MRARNARAQRVADREAVRRDLDELAEANGPLGAEARPPPASRCVGCVGEERFENEIEIEEVPARLS